MSNLSTPQHTPQTSKHREFWCGLIQTFFNEAAHGDIQARDWFAGDMFDTVSTFLFTPTERANIADAAYEAYERFHSRLNSVAGNYRKIERKVEWATNPKAIAAMIPTGDTYAAQNNQSFA